MSRDDYGRGRGFGGDWEDERDTRPGGRGPRSSEQYGGRRLEPAGTGDYGRDRARMDEYDDDRDDGPGFFERAADTVKSWFAGDDDDDDYARARRPEVDEAHRRELREMGRRDMEQGRISGDYPGGYGIANRGNAGARDTSAADYRGGQGRGDRGALGRTSGGSGARDYGQPSRISGATRTGGYGPGDRPSGYVELRPSGASGQSDARTLGRRETRELDIYRGGGSGRTSPGGYGREARPSGPRDNAPIGVTNRGHSATDDIYHNPDNAGSYGAGRLETDVTYNPDRIGTGAQAYGSMYGQSTGHGVPVDRYSGNEIESPMETGAARGAAGYGGRGTGEGRSGGYGGGTLGSTYGSVLGRGGDIERAQRGPHVGKGPKGYQRSDERIREEINERLMDDDRIDASEIDVEVSGGVVTINGKVDDRRIKWMAEDLVEEITGVKEVNNNLRVDRSYRSDTMR